MAEKDHWDRKQDKPVVDFGKSLPHESEIDLADGQIEEGETYQTTDDQASGVASRIHASTILISFISSVLAAPPINPPPPPRSWFDTSPRTGNHTLTSLIVRSQALNLTLIPSRILVHGAHGVAGFTSFVAGFDVEIDLRTFREKPSNVPFEMFGNGMSL
jgi:hypothetical protein